MPRGKPKGGHKGRSKRYSTPEEIAEQEEKRRRELEWKKRSGTVEEGDEEGDSDGDNDGVTVSSHRGGRGLEEEDEEEEEESTDDDADIDAMFSKQPKTKGVSDLIEIENPNRVQAKTKKVKDVDVNAKVELSRREREELERQRKETAYRKKHDAGLTDEAQRDLARLAIIRKQREEAAKKKELEKKAATVSAEKK